MDYLNPELVSRSIGFHGQPLQKIWEGERGEKDLSNIGVINPDYSLYQARQKHFSFQDRAKRLKLHQFMAKKASALFSSSLTSNKTPRQSSIAIENDAKGMYATIPPYSTFMSDKVDKAEKLKHLCKQLQPGDIIFGTVYSKSSNGMIIRMLCSATPIVRIFSDLNAKAYIPNSELIAAVDRKGSTRNYLTNDYVCCEIIEIMIDTEKVILGMKGVLQSPITPEYKVPFGLVSTDNFPDLYKLTVNSNGIPYDTLLEESSGFHNPHCEDYLSINFGLESNIYLTNMSSLRGRFSQQEYASDLRENQASKWAFRSVAAGIEHFKEGRHAEAFQCLNKALTIDSKNVEGLVARGALYANSGSFKKAVEDFEAALKLNVNHANARKYMGETLVALGRSYEEENKIEDAKKAYQDCLNILPQHEEAKNSLEFLWSKTTAQNINKQLIEPHELTLPALNIKIAEQNRQSDLTGAASNLSTSSMIASSSGGGGGGGAAAATNLGGTSTTINKKDESNRKDKKSKKKKSKSRKKHSSSSSSDSSSDSSDSSSESTSSSDSSSSSGSIVIYFCIDDFNLCIIFGDVVYCILCT